MNETIKEIPLDELHPFPDHPFGVRDDEAMAQTVESIREYGVLVPAIARPREEGGYELIAGHRRKHACELAGHVHEVLIEDIVCTCNRSSHTYHLAVCLGSEALRLGVRHPRHNLRYPRSRNSYA